MVENIDIDSVEGFCLKDRTVSVRPFVLLEDAGAGEDAIRPISLEPLEFTNPEALIMVTSYLSDQLDKMKKRRSERSESEDEDDDDDSSSAEDEEDIIDQLEQWIQVIENHIQFILGSLEFCQPISIEDDGTIDEKLFGFCCAICKCGPEKKKKGRSKKTFFCTQLTKGQKWHRHCCHGYAQRALSPTCLFMYKKFPGISTLVDPKKNKTKQQQHTNQKNNRRKYLSHTQKKLREERSKRRVTKMCNDDFDARKLFKNLLAINFCQASR